MSSIFVYIYFSLSFSELNEEMKMLRSGGGKNCPVMRFMKWEGGKRDEYVMKEVRAFVCSLNFESRKKGWDARVS